MNAIQAFFNFITTLFNGCDNYAKAFEKSGVMADRAMGHQVAQQDLVHAERMGKLIQKAQDAGVNLSYLPEPEQQEQSQD